MKFPMNTTPELVTGTKVSNKQLIPAIRENINNPENLQKLFSAYQIVFHSSVKYVSNKDMLKAEEAVGQKFTVTFPVDEAYRVSKLIETPATETPVAQEAA